MSAAHKAHPMEYEAEVKMITIMRRVLSTHFSVLVNRLARNKYYVGHDHGISGPIPSRHDSHFGGRRGKTLIKAYATDIYLDANNEYEKKLGDAMAKHFTSLQFSKPLGIDHIKWNKRCYSMGSHRVFPAPGYECKKSKSWEQKSCLHMDHLHVQFSPVDGDKSNEAFLLEAVKEIKKEIGPGSP